MYKLLVSLMLISAIQQLNLKPSDILDCRNLKCAVSIEKASRKVLQVQWKPISIFPEEAKRFQ